MARYSKHRRRKLVCDYCFQIRGSREKLTNHHKQCLVKNEDKQAVKLPPSGRVLKFTKIGKQSRALAVIHADFECTLDQTDHPNKPQRHTQCGYAYNKVCFYDSKYNSDLL